DASVSVLTDNDGRYVLTAPSSTGTLVFTGLGYGERQLPFDGQDVANATLEVSALVLDEIVTIAYGEKRRATMTESVGTVSAAEIGKATIASPDQAIQGRVPGVRVTTESGIPGAPVAIRIRGVGTVGNTQPLFVIDGVPVGKGMAGTSSPLATLNANDIESISVLRDASATAVYGMQSSNGVVLIETRRGSFGEPTIRYDGYMGVQRFPQYYSLNDAQAWLALEREGIAAENAYFGRSPSDADFVEQHPDLQDGSPVLDQLLARNTDWTRVAVDNNAPIMNHNLSVSGASDRLSYYVSAGYFAQDAIVDKWDLKRYSFRANSEYQVSDRLRFGETFSLSSQVTHRGSANYGDGTILNNTLQQPPIFLTRDPALITPTNPEGLTGNFQTGGFSRANLNSTNQLVDVNDRVTRVLGSLYGELEVMDGLTLRSQNSVDYAIGNQYFWQAGFSNEMTGFERPELAEDIRTDGTTIVSTNTLTYNTFLGNHALTLLGGIEANQSSNNSLSLQTTGFLNQQFPIRRIVSLGDVVLKKGGGAGEQNRLGYFGRLTYNFSDRYLLTATLRRDGVSTFAPGHQWGTFPAVSAGWRISEEPFFDVPWVNELKLRGSWGQAGNSEIPGGEYPQFVSVLLWAEYQIGDQIQLAPTPQPRLANEDLTWETNETLDFGFESSLFNNAVDLSFTWYRRDTKDFLLGIPVPVASGFTEAPINVGNMANKGIEVQAAYSTRLYDVVDLRLSGNLTTVSNRLTSLTGGVDEYNSEWPDFPYRTALGQPVGYFYGYKTCGVFQSGQEIPYTDNTAGGNQPQAGDMCFQDIRGPYERDENGNLVETPPDGLITPDDRTYLGKTIPDMYFGFNVDAVFGRFDMSAFFNGVVGVQKYNELRSNLENMAGGGDNMLATTQNRWTPENQSHTIPRAIQDDPADNARLSDRWVEDGDYLRLKTLQVGYTLPDNLFGGAITNTRVYVSATNLWTRTDYSGLDPEFATRGNAFNAAENHSQLRAGTDDGNIPQPRMFQIGVSTSF
ncbi:MAG: SusC/RagA family TonB-linked outer membrane protein, partial [Longimicrobiales bacterium]